MPRRIYGPTEKLFVGREVQAGAAANSHRGERERRQVGFNVFDFGQVEKWRETRVFG
jgi:hypothetical protein